MTSFTSQLAVPGRARSDPGKHVNYTYGMVLGVDDFTQEFAYLSGRDRWAVRDLGGYGTLSGLEIRYEAGAEDGADRGPRLTVSSGVAASPSGQLICVTPAQCAYLQEWMAANREAVLRRLPLGSPPEASPPGPAMAGGALDLYVVLCYADCPTDRAPVPGEPCRSEDELLLPSRLRDDFLLELRFDPPDQAEEVAVRSFVAWLRQVPVVAGADTDVEDLLAAAREAAGLAAEELSPPGPPPAPGAEEPSCPPVERFMATAPPPALTIPAERAAEFLRAAFRLWATELLPCWRATAVPCRSGCRHDRGSGDDDCVLLAHVVVDVLPDAAEDRLLVGPGGVNVEQDWRPYLLNLRLLQEWAITRRSEAPSGPVVVAGGLFDGAGAVPGPPYFAYGGLTATQRAASPEVYDLAFDDFDPIAPAHYVISGSALTTENAKAHTLEVLSGGQPAVRLRRAGTGTNEDPGFMLQITRFDGGGP